MSLWEKDITAEFHERISGYLKSLMKKGPDFRFAPQYRILFPPSFEAGFTVVPVVVLSRAENRHYHIADLFLESEVADDDGLILSDCYIEFDASPSEYKFSSGPSSTKPLSHVSFVRRLGDCLGVISKTIESNMIDRDATWPSRKNQLSVNKIKYPIGNISRNSFEHRKTVTKLPSRKFSAMTGYSVQNRTDLSKVQSDSEREDYILKALDDPYAPDWYLHLSGRAKADARKTIATAYIKTCKDNKGAIPPEDFFEDITAVFVDKKALVPFCKRTSEKVAGTSNGICKEIGCPIYKEVCEKFTYRQV